MTVWQHAEYRWQKAMLRMWVLWHVCEATDVEQICLPWSCGSSLGSMVWKMGTPYLSRACKCLQRRWAERANPEHSEAEAQCGFHKHHFCFLECQEVSLMCTWTTPKRSSGSLDFLHLVGQGQFWWWIVTFFLITQIGCIHIVPFLSSSWILHCLCAKLSILTKATAGKSQELPSKIQ